MNPAAVSRLLETTNPVAETLSIENMDYKLKKVVVNVAVAYELQHYVSVGFCRKFAVEVEGSKSVDHDMMQLTYRDKYGHLHTYLKALEVMPAELAKLLVQEGDMEREAA